MGRWAQRRRGRGGGAGSALIRITALVFIDNVTIDLTYSGNVTSGDFAGADFTSNPSTENPVGISQLSANQLELIFGVDVNTDTELVFNGLVTGVQTPQTVPY